jgi:glyoxylase-like metal-dependent hydrolase (beta-lactamase superfamily II)
MPGPVRQIAPGVYWALGRGITRTNVYLVRSDPSWVLVDTGWRGNAAAIRSQAEAVFGRDARPAGILLTHIHPDHAGSAAELARAWGVPVYVHPDELPMAGPDYPQEYVNPVDRRLSAALMRVLPSRTWERMRDESDLRGVVLGLDLHTGVPGLPEWECLPTPGHTPGHVALYRRRDGVLITGDAVLTIDVNSVAGIAFGRQRLSGPPRYFTWSWPAAMDSIAALAKLETHVLATGHGRPMVGAAAAPALHALSRRLASSAEPPVTHTPRGRSAGGGFISR